MAKRQQDRRLLRRYLLVTLAMISLGACVSGTHSLCFPCPLCWNLSSGCCYVWTELGSSSLMPVHGVPTIMNMAAQQSFTFHISARKDGHSCFIASLEAMALPFPTRILRISLSEDKLEKMTFSGSHCQKATHSPVLML
jgi:hypothetical protein